MPLVAPVQSTFGLGSNFIARLAASGVALDFSTYLGDLHQDLHALAPELNGSLWIAESASLSRIDFAPPATQGGVPLVRTVNNGASFIPGDVVAPGEIVSLIGQELAPTSQSSNAGSLPQSLQGVSVTVGGIAAPLYYVSASQINLQVPVELTLGSAQLIVH